MLLESLSIKNNTLLVHVIHIDNKKLGFLEFSVAQHCLAFWPVQAITAVMSGCQNLISPPLCVQRVIETTKQTELKHLLKCYLHNDTVTASYIST